MLDRNRIIQFISAMSHEIRTPFNAVLGIFDILGESQLTDDQKDLITTAERTSRSLLRIINDVLDYARISSGSVEILEETFYAPDIFNDVNSLFAPQAKERNIALIPNVKSSEKIHLLGDLGRIQQILMNFVSNAIKYSQDGHVEMIVETRSNQHNANSNDETNSDWTLICKVKDDGRGIAADKLEHIFDEFYMADEVDTRAEEGTGLEDARAIVKLAKPGASVVLMGAGFIGCIVLEALALRDVKLTVVEMENRMVPRMMNETSGNMIKRWCEEKGVAVHTSTRAESIEQSGSGLVVKLSNGENVAADLVISATGVKPNMQFAADSGIETDQGILVNHFLQTSDEDIYAAGDVCQGKDFSTGEFTVQAIQPTAVEHARVAANNMARGHHSEHAGNVNMNVLDTIGLVSASFGSWMGTEGGDSVELVNEPAFKYLSLQFEDDVLIGASSLGLTQHVGVLRGLIQSRTRLGDWKEKLKEDPLRIMEAYLACAQGQSTSMT